MPLDESLSIYMGIVIILFVLGAIVMTVGFRRATGKQVKTDVTPQPTKRNPETRQDTPEAYAEMGEERRERISQEQKRIQERPF